MPSTYTSNLRLLLQQTGENLNAWNDLHNSGVFRLVDSAIAGVTTVAVTNSDYTLTASNGTADEARAAVLKVTGALTANINIIIPNVTKTYDVANLTSGSFTVGIKTATGSAVTIPQGASVRVWCDGSNAVRKVSDSASEVSTHNADTNAHYAASTTQRGFIELADATEAAAGSSATLGITPSTLKSAVLAIFFPVGSVYTTTDSSFNPNTSWGGTWSLYAAGRVLVGQDTGQTEFDTMEETGGAKTHALTSAEGPAHDHFLFAATTNTGINLNGAPTRAANWADTAGSSDDEYTITAAGSDADVAVYGKTSQTGSGTAHNNLQPYQVVRFWKRTA